MEHRIKTVTKNLIKNYNSGRDFQARIHARTLVAPLDYAKLLGHDVRALERHIDSRRKENYESYITTRSYFGGSGLYPIRLEDGSVNESL